MSETYTAWDGKQYPVPPPQGWQLRSDGRYWPPEETVAAPVVAPPPTAPQPAAPQPAAPTPQPIPVPQQQTFNPGPPPNNKSSNTGLVILLIIVGLVVLTLGGCTLFFVRAANTIDDGFEEFEESLEEFEQNQIEARGEVSIDAETCAIVDGFPSATVLVENRSGGRSDYTVTVIFTDDTDRRLQEGFADIDNVEDNDDARVDVSSFESGVTGDITCAVGDVTRYSSDVSTN